jgi:phosphate starvation-inducible PhoH-like protein
MVIVSGPAGTSKTFLSVLAALELLNQKKMSDIVYVRSVVESADVKMGFLPGERDDKFSPYLRPLMDKLEEFIPKDEIKYLEGEGRLEGLPVGYLRGLNWNAKVIIGDEAQNMTKKEIVTLMTRIGEFSKIFLIGDPSQADINGRSGFQTMFDLFNDGESRENGIYTFQFTEDDIVRSKLVQFIAKKVKKLD